jgi:hypothetical protein
MNMNLNTLSPEQRSRWIQIEIWYSYHSRYRINDPHLLLWVRDCAFAELLGKSKPRKSKKYFTSSNFLS